MSTALHTHLDLGFCGYWVQGNFCKHCTRVYSTIFLIVHLFWFSGGGATGSIASFTLNTSNRTFLINFRWSSFERLSNSPAGLPLVTHEARMVTHIIVVHYKNIRPWLHFIQSLAEIFISSMFFSKFSQIALHTQNKLSFHNRSCLTTISPALNTELAQCPSSDLSHGGSKTHSNSPWFNFTTFSFHSTCYELQHLNT